MTVTDEDREAAANVAPSNERWGMLVRSGHGDSDPIVQAFARHRIEARRKALEDAADMLDLCSLKGAAEAVRAMIDKPVSVRDFAMSLPAEGSAVVLAMADRIEALRQEVQDLTDELAYHGVYPK